MITRGEGGSRYPPKVKTSFMNSPQQFLTQDYLFDVLATLLNLLQPKTSHLRGNATQSQNWKPIQATQSHFPALTCLLLHLGWVGGRKGKLWQEEEEGSPGWNTRRSLCSPPRILGGHLAWWGTRTGNTGALKERNLFKPRIPNDVQP